MSWKGRLLIQDESQKSLDTSADWRHGQIYQHEEEQEGPKGRDVHLHDGWGVGHKCQADPTIDNVLHVLTSLVGKETQDEKDYDSGVHRGQGVAETHNDRVPLSVVLKVVVAG